MQFNNQHANSTINCRARAIAVRRNDLRRLQLRRIPTHGRVCPKLIRRDSRLFVLRRYRRGGRADCHVRGAVARSILVSSPPKFRFGAPAVRLMADRVRSLVVRQWFSVLRAGVLVATLRAKKPALAMLEICVYGAIILVVTFAVIGVFQRPPSPWQMIGMSTTAATFTGAMAMPLLLVRQRGFRLRWGRESVGWLKSASREPG